MTDIVEQAARVLCEANGGNPDFTPKSYVNGIATGEVHDPLWVDYVEEAQALVDAGLVREPARTMPNRAAIAQALYINHRDAVVDNSTAIDLAEKGTDAVLELMADQPTVDGARPWEHEGHKPVQHRDGKPPWCHECGHTSPTPATPAQQIRDGQHRPAVEPRPATPEMRVEWRPKPRTAPDTTHIKVSATCRKCGTVTRVGMIARHGAPSEFPQSLLKCDCTQGREMGQPTHRQHHRINPEGTAND